jgi:cell division protein FtsI/penicillin-binding protein 2
MYMVVHGSSPYKTGSKLEDLSPAVAAKTGTAETFAGTTSTLTHSLIMFGPYKDPQVVIALAIPGASTSSSSVNVQMGHDIYKAYWKTVQSSSGY